MQQQSSKKWLIILLVILFLCAAAFGVWYFILRKEEDKSPDAAFKRYAVSLTDDNFDIITVDKNYADFKSTLPEEIAKNELYEDFFAQYDAKYQLFSTYQKHPVLSLPKIASAYAEDKKAGAQTLASENLAYYENLEDVYGFNFHKLYSDWTDDIIKLLKNYDSTKCLLSDGEIDYNCANKHKSQARDTILQRIAKNEENMNVAILGCKKDLISGLSKISQFFAKNQKETIE